MNCFSIENVPCCSTWKAYLASADFTVTMADGYDIIYPLLLFPWLPPHAGDPRAVAALPGQVAVPGAHLWGGGDHEADPTGRTGEWVTGRVNDHQKSPHGQYLRQYHLGSMQLPVTFMSTIAHSGTQ
jgi:hypothetical protein